MNHGLVILDRDGTVIADRHYLSDPSGVELLPLAAAGLQKLQALGLRLVLITNQSGIGRGFFGRQEVDAIHERLIALLGQEGVRLDGIFVCPHAPEQSCECRKPKPGLARRAIEALGLDLVDTFVVGDKPCDIQLGRNIGGITLLIRMDDPTPKARTGECEPHFVVRDLLEAARLIEKCVNDPDWAAQRDVNQVSGPSLAAQ
jgi:D-glycero-D-manno-heptose 1,7-bisphosphate phosphatase